MKAQTSRTIMTSQFSDYQPSTPSEGYLEQWLNKLKASEPQKYIIRSHQNQKNLSAKISKSNSSEIRSLANKSSLHELFVKENFHIQPKSNKLSEKPYVAAMKALQNKVKILDAQKLSLKQQIKQKQDQLKSNQEKNEGLIDSLNEKNQGLLLANNQYRMKLNIVEMSLCQTDRVRIQNMRYLEQIKRLENLLEESQNVESQASKRYVLLLKEVEMKTINYQNIQFQYQLAVEQLQVTKGQIKALKVKLMNYEYSQQENKSKNKIRQNDAVRTIEDLAIENQILERKLTQTSAQIKSVEQAYLSEFQKQQISLQNTKRENEVLKEKSKQLGSEMSYLKDNLNQKENTLLQMCKGYSKDPSLYREVNQTKIEDPFIRERKFSQEFDESLEIDVGCRDMNDEKVMDRKPDRSFEINSFEGKSRKKQKCDNHKKKSKGKEESKFRQSQYSTKSTNGSKLRKSSVLPFENALIKLKTQKLRDCSSDTSFESQNIFGIEEKPILSKGEDSREYKKILLIQAQKQAIKLYEDYQSILGSSKSYVNLAQRGENLGRLKQLDQQIKINNQKIHKLKQCFQ